MKLATLAAGAMVLALGRTTAIAATSFFVATSGADGPTCGTSSAPCKTIQFAIDLTDDKDRVIVGDGTYHECIVITSGTGVGGILVVADSLVNGAASGRAILDGEGVCDAASATPGPVVTVGDKCAVSGFAIKNGGASGVRGLGAASILSNIISANETGTTGGGIFLTTGSFVAGPADPADPEPKAVVQLNTIEDNTSAGDGGGIYVDARGDGIASVVEIATNTIRTNTAQGGSVVRGGGIAVVTGTALDTDSSTVTITNNVLSGNEARNPAAGTGSSLGGAIFASIGGPSGPGTETIVVGGSVTEANSIHNNVAEGFGGGISVLLQPADGAMHTLSVVGNEVSANIGGLGGGGIHARSVARDLSSGIHALDIRGNHVIGNHALGDPADPATMGGGGIYLDAASHRTADDLVALTVVGNEIRLNDTPVFGGGATLSLLADDDPVLDGATQPSTTSLRFENNLIAANRAQDTAGASAFGGGVALFARAIGAQATVVAAQRFLTVSGNLADAGGGGLDWSAAVEPDSTSGGVGSVALEASNSILQGNDGFAVGGTITPGGTISTVVAFNDTIDNVGGDYAPALGTSPGNDGNVAVDPGLDLFYIPPPCSPTIDIGDPLLGAAPEPLPNGGRVNLGHLGHSVDAPRTFPDVNSDGQVDGLDLLGIAVSFNAASDDARFLPGADRDLNDLVDGQDLAYVSAFFAQSCAVTARAR